MDLSKLADKFNPDDIEWRVQSSGENDNGVWCKVLAYVTNRAIMERLDSVCGPESWCNHYDKAPDGGVLCGISIKVDNEWVTKWDGAESTQLEAVKGGLSGAMKRAGVQWGIGRYLYSLTVTWGNVNKSGQYSAKTKSNKWFKWDAPSLPEWALPAPPVATEDQITLFAKRCGVEGMLQGEVDSLIIYYCNAKKVDIVPIQNMTYDLLQNLINKFETVYDKWKSVIEK